MLWPLPAADYFRVRQRALTFARSHEPDSNVVVLNATPAREVEVLRFGTLGSAVYAQFLVRLQMDDRVVNAEVERGLQNPTNDVASLRRFWSSPFNYRIVCTATNVIHHELVGCDICSGVDATCEVPLSASPVAPPLEFTGCCARALSFALSDHRYASADLLSIANADGSIVERYGTAEADDYADVLLRLEYSQEHIAQMVAMEMNVHNPNVAQVRELLARPRALRVTCTASDVIHHEWLRFAIEP